MGIDALDMAFRIEKTFGIKWARTDYDRLFASRRDLDRTDLVAGEVHDFVCLLLREQNKSIPHSAWHRVQKVLAETTRTSPSKIRRQTLLKKDLGFG